MKNLLLKIYSLGQIQSAALMPSSLPNQIPADKGAEAATRVQRYATLFEKIGSYAQVLNLVAALLLVVILVSAGFSGLPSEYIPLGFIGIGVIWAIGYIQTSLIRGLASYFQMRSIDFIERRK